MEKSEKVLWDKCFESMSEDEYCSTTLGKLNDIYKEYLIEKAAYDRLMGGRKKTLKEWANIFGKPVATQKDGDAYVYMGCPVLNKNGDWVGLYEGTCISMYIIGFTGDWKDSLTLPDGWEEA